MEATMERKPYSDREKVILASLVKEHGSAIENKKTDGATVQLKQQTWDRITSVYNMQPEINCTRSAKQLKKLWDNMKQKKRKEITEQKHSQLLTGGGPPTKKTDDPILDIIDIAAPNMDIMLDCPWDSTAIFENQGSSTVANSAAERNTSSSDIVVDRDPALLRATTSAAHPLPESSRSSNTSRFRRKRRNTDDDEKYWRVLKAKEAVFQQRELHKKRMEAANAEAELALLKLQTFKSSINDD